MTDKRWEELMLNDTLALTEQEVHQGWHFCPNWDDELIGPGMGEMDNCNCKLPSPRLLKLKWKIDFIFDWCNLWVGFHYARHSKVFYLFPIPMFGVKIYRFFK